MVWVDVLISWLLAADTDTVVQRQTHRQRQMSSSESLCISEERYQINRYMTPFQMRQLVCRSILGMMCIRIVLLTCGLPGIMKQEKVKV